MPLQSYSTSISSEGAGVLTFEGRVVVGGVVEELVVGRGVLLEDVVGAGVVVELVVGAGVVDELVVGAEEVLVEVEELVLNVMLVALVGIGVVDVVGYGRHFNEFVPQPLFFIPHDLLQNRLQ